MYNAVVIGGGFFGCAVSLHLAGRGRKVLLLEREHALLGRASYVNQARVHAGYHYPRSFRTAASSRNNLARFAAQYEACVDRSFTALYAIARDGSKVERKYFESFCRRLRLPLTAAPQKIVKLFEPRYTQAVYVCEEFAFDAARLAKLLGNAMAEAGIEVRLSARVTGVAAAPGSARVEIEDAEPESAALVINATYANINGLAGLDLRGAPSLKHQIAEVCLVQPPEEIESLGVTVMDGPYFSTMPFPARGLHSLTHVRHTPHVTWKEEPGSPGPDFVLASHSRDSRYEWMVRDAARFMPCMTATRLVESLYEVKTILTSTEVDDARPMTYHRDRSNPALISILGGKLDNVYDILEFLDAQPELVQ